MFQRARRDVKKSLLSLCLLGRNNLRSELSAALHCSNLACRGHCKLTKKSKSFKWTCSTSARAKPGGILLPGHCCLHMTTPLRALGTLHRSRLEEQVLKIMLLPVFPEEKANSVKLWWFLGTSWFGWNHQGKLLKHFNLIALHHLILDILDLLSLTKGFHCDQITLQWISLQLQILGYSCCRGKAQSSAFCTYDRRKYGKMGFTSSPQITSSISFILNT